METLEAIYSRRSIRKYKTDKIPPEIIEELLKAAMFAPSAGNEQPWHFIILNDRSIMNQIPGFHPFSEMIRKAPAAIIVCGDINLEIYKGFWIEDCCAASENILLAANSFGLGSVWCGIYPPMDRVEGFKKLLGLADNIIPLSLIPIGYPDEIMKQPLRFNQSRIHYNKW
jgi:nitroreductase